MCVCISFIAISTDWRRMACFSVGDICEIERRRPA